MSQTGESPREPKGAGPDRPPREPKGRGAAWTEERGTSDEGRQGLESGPEASRRVGKIER